MTEPAPSQPTAPPPPAGDAAAALGIKGVVTFFYYDDLACAIAFYEQVVGFRKVLENEWCGLFELRPGALLGLVTGEAGSQKPIAGPNKGAIVSVETECLETCLATMKARGVIPQSAALERGCAGRTWEFKIHDPAGYCLEFFSWIEPPGA